MRAAALALAAMLGACAPGAVFVADQAQIPAGALGGGLDPDVAAVNLAQYAFADSGRTYGKPLEGARAAVAMLYLAGQIYQSPRWANISGITKEQLLEGRQEVRAALGVAPGATAQQAVDGLVGAIAALQTDDRAAAARALDRPAFTLGGAATLDRLANLPYMRMANVGTIRAANQLFDSSGRDLY